MRQEIINIAKKYVKENPPSDIVRPCVERGGYTYFHIDFSGRPRYAGLPIIIKISSNGTISYVDNFKERIWAYKQAKAPLQ